MSSSCAQIKTLTFQFSNCSVSSFTPDFFLNFTAPFSGDGITHLPENVNQPHFRKNCRKKALALAQRSSQYINASLRKTTGIQKVLVIMQIFTRDMVQVRSKGGRKLQHAIQSKTSPKPHFPTISSSLLKSLIYPGSKIKATDNPFQKQEEELTALKMSTGRSGFPCGSVVKNPPATAGDAGSTPGPGRSPGEGNGNPSQYSCQEKPMDRRT